MKKVGVNGFGRIGRYLTRLSILDDSIEVAMVNDLADIETLAHLFKYDSVHGKCHFPFKIHKNRMIFENGKEILFTQHRNPEEITWKSEEINLVVESTGVFRSKILAGKHFQGGADKVIISAPALDDEVPSVVLGVNDSILRSEMKIVSNASCTTNSAAPMLKIIDEMCQIESAYITTVHSYTSDQRLHDAPHKDLRRARGAAQSIVPTTTGAAKALSKIFPHLTMGGCGIRVPVPNGSLTDLTINVKGDAPDVRLINERFLKASKEELNGILAYSDEPIVSSDIIGNSASCIFDSLLTSTVGNMIKLVGWYDNEAGYSNRLLDLIKRL